MNYFKTLCFFVIQIFSGQAAIARAETTMPINNLSLVTLDSYLSESESSFDDIVEGAEKLVRWHNNNEQRQTDIALIYLHGFSASRQEISPVTENLSDQLVSIIHIYNLCKPELMTCNCYKWIIKNK